METADFSFNLPPRLIAAVPPAVRGGGRLMALRRAGGGILHRAVADLPALLEPGSLFVLNDSRVRKARLYGRREPDGLEREFLLLEKVDDGEAEGDKAEGEKAEGACRPPHVWRCLCRRAARMRPGVRYLFPGGLSAETAGPAEGGVRLSFDRPVDDAYLDIHGHIPLPPYIRRADTAGDAERYQTVYARETGSAAAPTAGLHLTPGILAALAARGVETAFVTLHVGPGTFLPVRAARAEDHRMHEEAFCVPPETAALVEKAKAQGRPVVACGTTSARALESAWRDGRIAPGPARSSLFLYGDRRFNVVDRLFTNFHTPRSTLLMLAACFAGQRNGAEAGRRLILAAYDEAVRENYRFFSYGDAMLIQ